MPTALWKDTDQPSLQLELVWAGDGCTMFVNFKFDISL